MHRLFAPNLLLFAAAATGCSGAAADGATSSKSADTGAPACDVGPCAARPIVFIHGHGGSSSDGDAIFAALTAPGERFDAATRVGTDDHATWTANSIPRRSWLFSFDYYLKSGADPRGSFTDGVGRIGSDNQLCPDHDSYNEGVGHDYTNDLATFIDDVLRATGADKVDVVAHSMGGLVARSYLTFLGGRQRIANGLFLATPHLGVPAASLQSIVGAPDWMADHESTELDRSIVTSHADFSRCGIPGTDTWPKQLMNAELALPAEGSPTMHCMKGSKDLYIYDDSANYARCLDYQVVDGVDHSGLLQAPQAIAEARAVLGGTYKP